MDKRLFSLTAADLMSRDLVLVPQEMSLQGAARLLSRARVSGAPVVDPNGRCLGVLSTTDFLHWVENGNTRQIPNEAICHAWQIYVHDAAPSDPVTRFMTAEPVVATANTKIGTIVQMMIDARIHRVIVVDRNDRPIGIVSSTDILAAVARESKAAGMHQEVDTGYPFPVHG
jgi:CBS-domain-containing membrane protein